MTARIVTRLKKRGPRCVLLGDLYGPRGNANVIVSACIARLAIDNVPPAEIAAFEKYATRARYPEVLKAVLECFSVLPETRRQIDVLLERYGPARS